MDERLSRRLHEQQPAEQARVEALLRTGGGVDAVIDYRRGLRDLRLGLVSARAVWDSISDPQRRALICLNSCRQVVRRPGSRTLYNADGGTGEGPQRVATLRALSSRVLLYASGPATDLEAEFVLTERGRFILRQGPVPVSDRA